MREPRYSLSQEVNESTQKICEEDKEMTKVNYIFLNANWPLDNFKLDDKELEEYK